MWRGGERERGEKDGQRGVWKRMREGGSKGVRVGGAGERLRCSDITTTNTATYYYC